MDKRRWVVGEVKETCGRTLCLLTPGCKRSAVFRIYTNHVALYGLQNLDYALSRVSLSEPHFRSESCFVLQGYTQMHCNSQEKPFQDSQLSLLNAVNFLTAEWLTVQWFLHFKIPTTDVDLSVLASTPLPKTPDKSIAELEETKVALKELQRHFETYKTERTQAEE